MSEINKFEIDEFKQTTEKIFNNMAKIIYGQDMQIKIIITTLFAGGHILLEDMPGTGKTTLALLLSKSIHPKENYSIYKRIQFTPDLLPMDITGSNIFNPQNNQFSFHSGPVFSHIVLADELNRASPKVQSALLECMAEGKVSIERKTYNLQKPFFVIGTQNPIETEGTYPLPIAQLDRFYAKISLANISKETNKKILADYLKIINFEGIEPVVSTEEILKYQELVNKVYIDPSLLELIVDIIFETRAHKDTIHTGASPRASKTQI